MLRRYNLTIKDIYSKELVTKIANTDTNIYPMFGNPSTSTQFTIIVQSHKEFEKIFGNVLSTQTHSHSPNYAYIHTHTQEGPKKICVNEAVMRTTSSVEAYNCQFNKVITNKTNMFNFIHDLRLQEFLKFEEMNELLLSGNKSARKRRNENVESAHTHTHSLTHTHTHMHTSHGTKLGTRQSYR